MEVTTKKSTIQKITIETSGIEDGFCINIIPHGNNGFDGEIVADFKEDAQKVKEITQKQEKETESLIAEPAQVVAPAEQAQEPTKRAYKEREAQAEDFKCIILRVSKDFKSAVKLYCYDNDITETDLTIRALENLQKMNNVSELMTVKYDVDKKGKDREGKIRAVVKDSAGRFLVKATIQLMKNKSYIIEQAIAREIGYKKTLTR